MQIGLARFSRRSSHWVYQTSPAILSAKPGNASRPLLKDSTLQCASSALRTVFIIPVASPLSPSRCRRRSTQKSWCSLYKVPPHSLLRGCSVDTAPSRLPPGTYPGPAAHAVSSAGWRPFVAVLARKYLGPSDEQSLFALNGTTVAHEGPRGPSLLVTLNPEP